MRATGEHSCGKDAAERSPAGVYYSDRAGADTAYSSKNSPVTWFRTESLPPLMSK